MKSYLQAHAEMSKLDASVVQERRAGVYGRADNNAAETQAVIPHLKERYDPEHPDADWAGNVHRSYKKKASYSEHVATRQNLMADEKGGLMPDTQATIASSSFSGKKMFEPHQVPSGDANVPGIKFQSAVYQVGPGADINCSTWKTSYEAQTSSEATPKDVYALGTRQNSQHKRHVTPMYEKPVNLNVRNSGRTPSPSFPDSNFSSTSSPASSRGNSPVGLTSSDSSGSLSGRRMEPRRSLLAGIGKLVAAEDTSDQLARPEHHLSSSFVDPTRKVLIAEIHHNVTLGYTGGRKSSFR